MVELYTWEALATSAGCCALTAALTQLLKGIGWLKRVPAQLLSYLLTVAVYFPALYFTDGLRLETGVLALLNCAVISLAANGAYDAVAAAGGSRG